MQCYIPHMLTGQSQKTWQIVGNISEQMSNDTKLTNPEFSVCKPGGRWPTFTSRYLWADIGCFKTDGLFIGTQSTAPCSVVTGETVNSWHVTRQVIDTWAVVTTQQVAAVMTHCAVIFIGINTGSCLLWAALAVLNYIHTLHLQVCKTILMLSYLYFKIQSLSDRCINMRQQTKNSRPATLAAVGLQAEAYSLQADGGTAAAEESEVCRRECQRRAGRLL